MIENLNQYHSNLYELMESLGCLYKKKKILSIAAANLKRKIMNRKKIRRDEGELF
jgi:hypothetical protein